MELSQVILSVIILIFIAVIIFISIMKEFTSYKKIIEWILIAMGFVSFYILMFSVHLISIKFLFEKGITPILTLILLFIIPITGLLSFISFDKIKLIIKKFSI